MLTIVTIYISNGIFSYHLYRHLIFKNLPDVSTNTSSFTMKVISKCFKHPTVSLLISINFKLALGIFWSYCFLLSSLVGKLKTRTYLSVFMELLYLDLLRSRNIVKVYLHVDTIIQNIRILLFKKDKTL